jgi:hypothetical protein
LLAHNLNHFRPRDETGAWKSLQNCTGAKGSELSVSLHDPAVHSW